jgi:hypothetical protein
MLEPKNFNEASKDDHWVKEMNDELDQIEKNNTWETVHRPEGKNIISSVSNNSSHGFEKLSVPLVAQNAQA